MWIFICKFSSVIKKKKNRTLPMAVIFVIIIAREEIWKCCRIHAYLIVPSSRNLTLIYCIEFTEGWSHVTQCQGYFFSWVGEGGRLDRKVTAHKPSSGHWNRPETWTPTSTCVGARIRLCTRDPRESSHLRNLFAHQRYTFKVIESRFRENPAAKEFVV